MKLYYFNYTDSGVECRKWARSKRDIAKLRNAKVRQLHSYVGEVKCAEVTPTRVGLLAFAESYAQ